MPGGRTGKKGERTVVEKRGKCVNGIFGIEKGRDFFLAMYECFSRDKGWAAILLVLQKKALGMLLL